MNKQQQELGLKIACIAMIVTFFLNWLASNGLAQSGFDIVFGSHGRMDDLGFLGKLALVLLVASSGVILYYSIKKPSVYPVAKKMLFAIPALAVVLFFLAVYSKVSEMKHRLSYMELSTTSFLAVGFWLALLAAGFVVYLGFVPQAMDKPGQKTVS